MSQNLIESPYGLTFIEIAKALGNSATVHLKSGRKIDGYLYNIDPTTFTILLLKGEFSESKNPNEFKIFAIMNHAIDKLQVKSTEDSIQKETLDSLINTRIEEFAVDSEEMQQRKKSVISLFESNRIPVKYSLKDPTLHIMERAHINPPYVSDSISCDNEIILKRVKEMISQIPFSSST
ncbi:hypothetical protein G9A89_002827 [Geosiphon pyriformis]|nr:hypothetical protein G9A89_002827 [Geosiphon pyriformis]